MIHWHSQRVNKQLVQVNSYYNCHYLRLIQPILYFLDDEEQAQSLSDNEAEVVSEFQCECPCCTMGDVCQPLGVEGSKITYSHSSQQPNMKRTYCRSIQTSWYQKYSWITVCTSSYKIFCNPCRQAKDKGLLSYSKRRANCFIEKGFGNWKNALAKFKSSMHQEAVMKLAVLDSSIDVGAQLSKQVLLDQKFHQSMFFILLSSIRFLARQGLALRGHSEDVDSLDGNLYNLLLLRAEDRPELKTWVYRKEYTSPEIVNEIITLMGNTVLREILLLILLLIR